METVSTLTVLEQRCTWLESGQSTLGSHGTHCRKPLLQFWQSELPFCSWQRFWLTAPRLWSWCSGHKPAALLRFPRATCTQPPKLQTLEMSSETNVPLKLEPVHLEWSHRRHHRSSVPSLAEDPEAPSCCWFVETCACPKCPSQHSAPFHEPVPQTCHDRCLKSDDSRLCFEPLLLILPNQACLWSCSCLHLGSSKRNAKVDQFQPNSQPCSLKEMVKAVPRISKWFV